MSTTQKVEKKDEVQEEQVPRNTGEGLNLIAPQLQRVKEETKKKFEVDIRVVLFVFFIVLVSLGVAGYNWYTNMLLVNERSLLEDMEQELEGYTHTIESNNQILERYIIYDRVQEGFISSKEVLHFWQEVSQNLGEIRKIELTNGVNFEVSGRAETLRDVTKLWHFLSIDDRVQTVTLEGLSVPAIMADDSFATFSFKGVLNMNYFNEKK